MRDSEWGGRVIERLCGRGEFIFLGFFLVSFVREVVNCSCVLLFVF